MEVPAWAYKRHAVNGDIDANELDELEKFASSFTTKEALSPFARDLLMTTGVATAAPIIGYGAMKGIDALGNIGAARREKRNLDKILAVHPDIGDASNPRVAMAYSTLKKMNPEFAGDPLLAGPLMKQIVESRMDPMNPSSGSYVDPGQAAKLMELRNNSNKVKGSPSLSNMVGQSITQALPKGFDSALNRQRQLSDLQENRAYQEGLFDTRRDEARGFQAGQDALRRQQQQQDLDENRAYQEGLFADRRDEARQYQAGQRDEARQYQTTQRDEARQYQAAQTHLNRAYDREQYYRQKKMEDELGADMYALTPTQDPVTRSNIRDLRDAQRRGIYKLASFSIRETVNNMRLLIETTFTR